MSSDLRNSEDIGRLCEAVGVDPSGYVRFHRPRGPARKVSPAVNRNRAGGDAQQVISDNSDGLFRNISISVASYPQPAAPITAEDRSSLNVTSASPSKVARIALLSISGGTGKTLIAGLLAYALAARGYSALLADHSRNHGVQDLFPRLSPCFGSASPQESSRPFQVFSLFRDGKPQAGSDSWFRLLAENAQFIVYDGVAGTPAAAAEMIASGATVLVPILPDLASARSAVRLNSALRNLRSGSVHFFLNRFDLSQPAQRAIRGRLQAGLGDRLLPIEIGECSLLQHAAARGLAAGDVASDLAARADLSALADWVELTRPAFELPQENEVIA